MKSFKIGNVRLGSPLFLAPMVDVTDLPYRILCRKAGAAMTYVEMIYIDAILNENKKTKNLMLTNSEDKPVGLQVTGDKVKDFEKFSKLPELRDYDLVDLNCGCPSIRITGNKAGSYLLKNPDKIGEMIKILKSQDLTVTAKIRLGFKKNNVLSVAKKIEKAGADALTLHSRLAIHGKSVKADWSQISKIKNQIGIPLIGNGDIFSGEDAKNMLDETNCDGVMIARGAIGNPLIFREISRYLKTGKEKEITKDEKLNELKKYLSLQKKFYKNPDMGRIKYVGANFLKDFGGAAKNRESFMKCKTFLEIEKFVKNL